jgi:hypothetical protein
MFKIIFLALSFLLAAHCTDNYVFEKHDNSTGYYFFYGIFESFKLLQQNNKNLLGDIICLTTLTNHYRNYPINAEFWVLSVYNRNKNKIKRLQAVSTIIKA